VWLGARSITQKDPADVQRQLELMGTIYKEAKLVSVLLPPSDNEAARILVTLKSIAQHLLRFEYTIFVADMTIHSSVPDTLAKELENSCEECGCAFEEPSSPEDSSTQRVWTIAESICLSI
jgi:hypothetical protein